MGKYDNNWCGFEDMDSFEVCVGIAETLPHPAILADHSGRLIYKNKKFSWINLKWRVGASIERYVGRENFNAALSTKARDYNAFFVDNIPAVSLKIGGNFFIVFLSDFEVNSTYAVCIYEYVENVLERVVCQIKKMKSSTELPQHKRACVDFEKRMRLFFDNKSTYGKTARGVFLGDRNTKRHRIEDILKMLESISRESSLVNKCNIAFKEHVDTYDFYVHCSSDELGAVLSMMLFSCIACSSSKRPQVEISYLKNKSIEVGEVTFSVKSNIEEDEIQSIMFSNGYVDERSICFKAIRALSLKNFWTFRVYCSGGRICFSLAMIGERIAPFALSEKNIDSTAVCVQAFERFLFEVLLLGKKGEFRSQTD